MGEMPVVVEAVQMWSGDSLLGERNCRSAGPSPSTTRVDPTTPNIDHASRYLNCCALYSPDEDGHRQRGQDIGSFLATDSGSSRPRPQKVASSSKAVSSKKKKPTARPQ